MRPHQISLISIALALLLTSCVPIPATPPDITSALPTPTPDLVAEIKVGYSDLANGLAKIDQSDDIQQYAQLLNEFADCMQVLRNEEENMDLSDREMVALTFYYAGMFTMAQIFAMEADNLPVGDGGEFESSIYNLLEMVVSACQGNE